MEVDAWAGKNRKKDQREKGRDEKVEEGEMKRWKGEKCWGTMKYAGFAGLGWSTKLLQRDGMNFRVKTFMMSTSDRTWKEPLGVPAQKLALEDLRDKLLKEWSQQQR